MSKVLVIGDSCTDIFRYGKIERLSPEAPVPVIIPTHQTENGGMSKNVKANLEALGLEMHVPEPQRLPTLTTVRIPDGVDGKAFSQHLLNTHGIEVGGGLGSLAGKIWRVGLMGYNSTPGNVDRLLNLFETELPRFSGSVAVAA